MRLGEAYVNVRADLKPYANDLRKGLRPTTEAFEKALDRQLGERIGKNLADGTRDQVVAGARQTAKDVERTFTESASRTETQIRNRTRRGTRDGFRGGFDDVFKDSSSFVTAVGSALASALDDGISALPLQVKAAITAGLILATPVIIAQVGAAIAAGTSLGVAGLGVALASQLTPVQDAFTEVLASVRNDLTQAAGPLIAPLVDSLNLFAERAQRVLGPILNDIFVAIAPGLERFLTGAIAGVEAFFRELRSSGLDINTILSDLAIVAGELGAALGVALRLILSTGEDGRIALRDLATLLELTVIGAAALVNITTQLYGRIRTIVALIQGDFPAAASSLLQREIQGAQGGIFNLGNEYGGLTAATDEQTRAFKEQAKAAEDAKKAIDEVIRAADDLISAQIDSEESWDRLNEGIKENGRNLDISGEKGRENARNIQRYLNDVRTELQGLVDSGEITAEQAEEQFARQATAAEKLFGTTAEGRRRFQELFGEFIQLSKFRFDPSPWIAAFNKIGAAVQTAIGRIKELQRQAAKAGLSTNIKVTGGTQLMADGGRVTQPTSIIAGENYRPEIILPETKPARAAEILSNSPLGALLGGGETMVVAYFDGEPFQARIVRTVRGINKSNARTISQVPRSI